MTSARVVWGAGYNQIEAVEEALVALRAQLKAAQEAEDSDSGSVIDHSAPGSGDRVAQAQAESKVAEGDDAHRGDDNAAPPLLRVTQADMPASAGCGPVDCEPAVHAGGRWAGGSSRGAAAAPSSGRVTERPREAGGTCTAVEAR